ncbi:hypothetical protein [Tenacibaculum amylolyticum]|uniref:hypothetical protein n=1 Tax=Tenacibaculum amylolyticum TaxID=104269 RepID=UPI0038B47FCC
MEIIRKTLARVLNTRKYYTSYYRNAIYKYTDFNSYFELFSNIASQTNVTIAKKEIAFLEDIPMGSSFNTVKNRIYGSFRIVRELKHITMLLSEIKLYDFKFTLEMHFFRDKLVFFKYVFKNKEQKDLLIDLVLKKYFNKEKEDRCNSLYATDTNNNYIHLEDEVHLSISYLTLNFGFFEYLTDLKEEEEMLIMTRNKTAVEELFNKL